jgi:hypothetical protein
MRTLLAASLAGLLASSSLTAAGWNKAYFAATKPGSFATARTTSNVSPPSTSTLMRLADENGQVVIEQKTDFHDKKTPNSTNRYVLAKGFDADRDLIDYMKGLVASRYAVGASTKFQDMPATAIDAMKKMPTYAENAVFKGTEAVAGKPCDHYSYTRIAKGDPQLLSGDVWLNADVPFGVVKETTKTTDPSGKVLFTTESLLVESGTRPLPAAKAKPATQPPAKKKGGRGL